ncbi:MAG: EpsG family protein [Candidatus Paralactobacillus gallistercoris]|uniref:EpsG family protein n=1 Tax=Candidatus Paralactobacillus gallistercoris TaxID=2838724 RepID=A0A948TJW9_9LACO|nr:EpsG family protein [Candidatus Paralactobacillus gallistercoris]
MSLFITLFIILACLSLIDFLSEHNYGLFISTVILAVIAGVRYNVGYDYGTYYQFYLTGNHSFEKGYVLLNNLAHYFHLSFFTFELLFSLLTMGLLFIFLRKYVRPGLGNLCLLYYFARFYWVRDLGQIRSSLAAVICLFAIKYISEKRLLPFLIITCIAESIHKGSFIIIAAYLMANYFNKHINYFKTITYLLLAYMVGLFLKASPALVSKLTNGSAYVTASVYTENSSASIITLIIQIIVILLYVWIRMRQGKQHSKFMDAVANVYLTGTLIALTLIGYKTLGYRLDTLLNTTEILMVPYIIDKFFSNKIIVVLINIAASAIVLYMIMFSDNSYLNFIPFTTVFTPIK